jgi:hypothetical protein
MSKTRPPYTPEFRRQIIELVRAGRSPDELAKEFEPTAQSNPQLGGAGRARCRPARRWARPTNAALEGVVPFNALTCRWPSSTQYRPGC